MVHITERGRIRLNARALFLSNTADYAKFRSRSHRAVIRVYDAVGNVLETHEHKGDFREW